MINIIKHINLGYAVITQKKVEIKIYLFGTAEHVENVYLAIKSMHVSVSSLWKAIKASSIGGFKSVTGARVSNLPVPDIGLSLRLLPYKTYKTFYDHNSNNTEFHVDN